MKFKNLKIGWSVVWGIMCVMLIGLWVRSYWWIDYFQHVSSTIVGETCPYDGKLIINWNADAEVAKSAMERPGEGWHHLWTISVESWRGKSVPPLRQRLFQSFALTRNPNQFVVPFWSLALLSLMLSVLPWIRNLRWRFSLRSWFDAAAMSNFSLTDLLLATAFTAIGITMLVTPFWYPPLQGQLPWQGAFPVIIFWCSGGALIGAGLLAPFHKIKTGVVAGLATATLALLLALCCLLQ